MLSDFIKTIPHYVLPKRQLTILAGCLANVKNPSIKNYVIQQFIKLYQVNMSEAAIEEANGYETFNEFFIRYLKPGSRPLASADIISPVDGAVSELGRIHAGQLIQAKGKQYTVAELLAGDEVSAKQFEDGRFATVYLSPKDYHRVHMPIDAELLSMTYIPGTLFSVQPLTTRVIPKLFARNERLVVMFNTRLGPMAMVLVGATIVGAIGTRWTGDVTRSKVSNRMNYSDYSLKQGEEMGYFKLGSTVVLLFANGNQMHWDEQLTAGSELKLGQAIGHSDLQ